MGNDSASLLGDRLWSALRGCILRFQAEPYHLLYEVEADYSKGFDAGHINRLAAEVGLASDRPIFRLRQVGQERWLDIYHPNLPDPVAWLTWAPGFYRDDRPDLVQQTVGYLTAWLRCRQEHLKPAKLDGPVEPYRFCWQGREFDLSDMAPQAWKLLIGIWSKPTIPIPELAVILGKSKRVGYEKLKPTVNRLNQAIAKAGLAQFFWTKKRGENALSYNGPSLGASVAQ